MAAAIDNVDERLNSDDKMMKTGGIDVVNLNKNVDFEVGGDVIEVKKNGFVADERRPEKSRGCFVGVLVEMGSVLASSAQLKQPEMGDFG